MVPEEYPFVCRFEVMPVPQPLRRRCAIVVQGHHFGRDKLAVESESDHVSARGCEHKPDTVDGFSPAQSDIRQTKCRHEGKGDPHNKLQNPLHYFDGLPALKVTSE